MWRFRQHAATLSACLIASGLVILLLGRSLTDLLPRVSTLKVAGVFELALAATSATPDAAEDSGKGTTDPGRLSRDLERKLRQAFKYTSIRRRERSRSEVLSALSGRGYLDPTDAAAIEAFFREAPERRTALELVALNPDRQQVAAE